MEWRLEYDSEQLRRLGITIEQIQQAVQHYCQKEFLGTQWMENGRERGEWIRLVLLPQRTADGFNPAQVPHAIPSPF